MFCSSTHASVWLLAPKRSVPLLALCLCFFTCEMGMVVVIPPLSSLEVTVSGHPWETVPWSWLNSSHYSFCWLCRLETWLPITGLWQGVCQSRLHFWLEGHCLRCGALQGGRILSCSPCGSPPAPWCSPGTLGGKHSSFAGRADRSVLDKLTFISCFSWNLLHIL